MPRTLRSLLTLALGLALLGAGVLRAPSAAAADEQCFPETGLCVRGAFLDYWQGHSGLAINGYPLTEQRLETLEDGRAYTVQYFERTRLEYHPEKAQQFQVLLGQFGRSIHPADPAVAPQPGATYFPETGHNVAGGFLAYWQNNGGLAQFGYPLSEVFAETLENNQSYQVQYFERARFEYHPENPAPYDVLLGQFGRRVLAGATPLALAPCAAANLAVASEGEAGAGQRFATVYLTNTGAQACALRGTPQVQLRDGAGSVLSVAYAANVEGPVGIVALPPSEIATFSARWTNWCGPDTGIAQMRVTLPDGGGEFTTAAPATPPCLGAGQPSGFGVNPFQIGDPAAHANVVIRFYKAINAKDYRTAYELLGADRQAQQSYAAFAAGYADTTKVTVIIGAINGASGPETNRVAVTLAATQANGTTLNYTGTYDVGADNGTLKILAANIAAAP